MRASRGRVLVRRLEAETVSSGGVIIPDTEISRRERFEEAWEGMVVSVGLPGYVDTKTGQPVYETAAVPHRGNVMENRLSIQPGDVVLFRSWGRDYERPVEVEYDGETLWSLCQSQVLGVKESV